jgi:hypothetical protein
MTSRTAIPTLLLVACAIAPRPASAYVREVTSIGIPVAWKNPCVAMHLFLGDPPPVLTADQFLQAGVLAASVWSQPALACSDIRLGVLSEPEPTSEIGHDGRNIIAFRREAWCSAAFANANPDGNTCYPSSALAITTIFKNRDTGEILDTDILFNAVNYAWGDLVALPNQTAGTTVDFQNALTHELGHVIGLDHSCYTPNDGGPRLLDNTGQPAIDCVSPSLPASVAESMMYPSVSPKDTPKRDLSPDDQQGVCEIYPFQHDVCPAADGDGGSSTPGNQHAGGCSTLADQHSAFPTHAGGRRVTVAILGLLTAWLVLVRRRRVPRI